MTLDKRNIQLDSTDQYISRIFKELGVDFLALYTTGFEVCRIQHNNQYTVLWDMSFWELYEKYLQFIYFMYHFPDEKSPSSHDALLNKLLKDIFTSTNDRSTLKLPDVTRMQMLGTVFNYLAFKFYPNAAFSYCFSLLFDSNNVIIKHTMSDEEYSEFQHYLSSHLAIAKLFCVAHELGHIDKFENIEQFIPQLLRMIPAVISSGLIPDSKVYDGYNISEMLLARLSKSDQSLHKEISADCVALSIIDQAYKSGILGINPSEYLQIVPDSIDEFFNLQSLTNGLYSAWNHELPADNAQNDNHSTYDVFACDDSIRLLALCFSLFFLTQGRNENDLASYDGKKLHGIVRNQNNTIDMKMELANLASLAYNPLLSQIIGCAIKQKFITTSLTVSKARDAILNWNTEESSNEKTNVNPVLKGGNVNGIDFYLLAARYRIY